MSARLFCKTGRFAGTDHEIVTETTMGSAADNTVVLPEQTISRKHTRIHFDAQQQCFVIEDLDSRNGTELDGVRLSRPERLGTLHVITLARKHDFIFYAPPPAPVIAPRPTVVEPVAPDTRVPAATRRDSTEGMAAPVFGGAASREPEPAPPRAEGAATLRGGDEGLAVPSFLGGRPETRGAQLPPDAVTGSIPIEPRPIPRAPEPLLVLRLEWEGSGEPQRYVLREGEQTLGRAPGCEIHVRHESLSRRHATVMVRGGTVTVRDLGSTNKTFVSDIELSTATELRPGDVVRFGSVRGTLAVEP